MEISVKNQKKNLTAKPMHADIKKQFRRIYDFEILNVVYGSSSYASLPYSICKSDQKAYTCRICSFSQHVCL